jgi:putative aminopeptidase FrvX
MIEFDDKYFREIAKEVFTCDSPTGFTHNVIKLVKEKIDSFGYSCRIMNNGALEVSIEGEDKSKTVATSAHCDTLGLMVRSIKADGHLALTKLGGPITPTLDGEYCRIYTRDGKVYKGTILSTSAATHVYPDANTKSRDIDNLEVRLDELVHSKEDVEKLGIQNGDIVCYDPKFEITENGFLKTRFIDDKASVVVLLMLLKYASEHKLKFAYNTKI